MSECLLSTEGKLGARHRGSYFFKLSKKYPIDVYKTSCFDTPGSYFMTGLQYYFKESNLIFFKTSFLKIYNNLLLNKPQYWEVFES